MQGIIGKKLGMTHLYDDNGVQVPVTVIEVGPCPVLALRTRERHGYSAVQLGFGQRKLKNVSKAVQGHILGAGLTEYAPQLIREFRLDEDPEYSVGDTITARLFKPGDFVDISGITKGRGFQGVVKRWRFGGGRKTHGFAWHRAPGSVGMCEFPGKIYKGRKMPGHMGSSRCTVQNLRVMQVRAFDNVILVRGAIPGANGNFVSVCEAKKKKALAS